MKKRKLVPYILMSSLVLSSLSGSLTVFAESALTEKRSQIVVDQEALASTDEEKRAVTPQTGKSGTCSWTLDAEGVLTIGAGTIGTVSSIPRKEATKVVFGGPVVVPEDGGKFLFQDCTAESYENMENLDVSRAATLGQSFKDNKNLKSIDISHMDTSKVKDFGSMFSGCESLESININGIDTSNGTSFVSMFYDCTSLSTLDISDMDMRKGTDIGRFLGRTLNLKSLSIGKYANITASELPYIQVTDVYTGAWEKSDGTKVFGDSTMFVRNYNPATDAGTYVWQTKEAAPVTVNYVDTEGNTLAESDVLTGKQDTAFESVAKEITGYELKETPKNATGTFTDKAQTVTYVYQAIQGGEVTVNYVDTEGNTLAESEVLAGGLGTTFETESKAITGYELKEIPTNATGTFTDETQTVTYVYQALQSAPVTVNYVDTEGNTLAESDNLTGTYGTTFESKAKEIKGYELKETPTNATGTFTEDAQTVTYVYQAVEGGDITVNYVDTEGKVLDTETLKGKFNENYTTEAKTIEGYTLKTTPKNATGVFTLDAQTVTYVYNASVGAPVTVRYINQLGNEIAASTTLNGKVGQTVTATAKTPGGYTLTSASNTQEATIGTTEQTITFEYQGNAASKVTTEYVDTDGVRIAPVKTISGGNVGDAYTTEAETIQGYTLQATPENASGFRTQGAMTVTYVYKKNAAQSFAVNYVGVQQQKVVGFVPEGVTTSKVSLMIKKDGTNEWVDTGYTATPAADTGYFAIESRFVKDTKDFLLNNKDQIKVVFTAENGDNYEGIQVVQPYTAPVVNDFTEGDEYLTGSVPNGANQIRVSINGNLMRVVNNGPLIADDAGIDAVTGAFSIWAKTWCEGAYGSSPIQQTKTGDVITVDYGVQIYGAFNNPSTTIIVK